jgi:integrase
MTASAVGGSFLFSGINPHGPLRDPCTMGSMGDQKRKARGNGEGSIFKNRYGTYTAVLTVDVVNGKQIRRQKSARTATEARSHLRSMIKDRDANIRGSGNVTVETYLRDWVKHSLPSRRSGSKPISDRTISNYQTILDVHVIPALGSRRLDRLEPQHVDQMLQAMAKDGKARNTVARARSVLSMALDRAVTRGEIPRNPARLAEIPQTLPRAERKSLTVDQATSLLAAARGRRYEAAWTVQLLMGLRPGEVLGLRWDDIDFDMSLLLVRHALHQNGQVMTLGEPKTKQSKRALHMPITVIAALKAHRVRQAEEMDEAGELWVPTNLVFPTSIGTATDHRHYRRSFQRAVTAAGIEGEWTPHELRHSCVSLLSHAGVPLEEVADLVGHASTRMTSEIYRHQVSPTVSAAVGPMDGMFGDQL